MPSLEELQARVDALRRLPSPATRKQIRIRAGLTRTEVAALLGVTAAAIYNWEVANGDPGKATVREYVDLLDQLRDRANSDGTDAA